jgi:hypothetical protein
MSVRRTRIAACVAAIAASAFLSADTIQAQRDCAGDMTQTLNSIREFNEEAKTQSMDFVIDTTLDVSLGDASRILADHTAPSQASAHQMELHKIKLETWESIQKTFGVTVEELYRCMAPGSGCSLQDFVKRQSQAFQRWMQTFSSESTQGARDRVEKARELLQNNVKRLAGNATGSIRAAVGCMDQHIKAGSTADAVDARQTGPAHPTPPKSGGGAGTAVKVGLGVGGAVAAGIVLKNALGDLKDIEAANALTSTTTTPTAPASTGSRFAGTYDFSYVSPLGPQALSRYWFVRTDGMIGSTDGLVSGSVDDSGNVQFKAPCWTNSGGTATFSGTLSSNPKSGSGRFTCALNNINGGTWRVDNGR